MHFCERLTYTVMELNHRITVLDCGEKITERSPSQIQLDPSVTSA